MVSQREVQGRIYRFGSKSEAFGLETDVSNIVRNHMVLVLDVVPNKKDHVKVMTITSTVIDTGDYVPISPTPKKGYPVQLHLRQYHVWHQRTTARSIPILPKFSYLKIDSSYEVPIQMLVEERDCQGNPLMIWARHQGGLGELRDHVRRRDLIRENEKLYHQTLKGSNEEDGI